MDNYVEELINIAKLPFNEIVSDYKIIMISNKVFHICNFIKILDFSSDRIVIKVKKMKNLTIIGGDLQICNINKGEIVIKGNIFSCDFGEDNGK